MGERLKPVVNCNSHSWGEKKVLVSQEDIEACGEILPDGKHDNAFQCPVIGRWVAVVDLGGKVICEYGDDCSYGSFDWE